MSTALPTIFVERVDAFLPRGSWLSTLALDVVRVSGGDKKGLEKTLGHLAFDAEDVGPVACLTVAKALQRIGHPKARGFARKGLGCCNERGFQRDRSILLKAGTDLRDLADIVSSLAAGADPTAVNALAPELKIAGEAAIAAAQNASPEDRTDALLNALWNNGLEERVRAELRLFEGL